MKVARGQTRQTKPNVKSKKQMPNNIETNLTITAPVAVVERIRKNHFDDGALSLASVRAVPYHASNDAQITAQQNLWGTDQDSYDAKPLRITPAGNDTILRASFMNAWHPPIPVLDALAKLYPDAEIKCKSDAGRRQWVNRSTVDRSTGSPYKWVVDKFGSQVLHVSWAKGIRVRDDDEDGDEDGDEDDDEESICYCDEYESECCCQRCPCGEINPEGMRHPFCKDDCKTKRLWNNGHLTYSD